MHLVKLKSWQEIRDSGIFKIQILGDMVNLIRKSQKGDSGVGLSLDYFGETVLVTDHIAIHSNALKLVPEILDSVVGDGYVSQQHHKRITGNLHKIDLMRNNNHQLEVSELQNRIKQLESQVAVLKNNSQKKVSPSEAKKSSAKIKSLEAQLTLSRRFTNEWRHKAHLEGVNTAGARASEEKQLQDIGAQTYREHMKEENPELDVAN